MKRIAWAAIVAMSVSLAGCSLGGSSTDNESQVDPSPTETEKSYKVGDKVRVIEYDENNKEFKWDVTVTGAETTDTLKNADDNEEYYSGENYDAPEHVDASPEPGNEFIHITYEQTNVSDAPDSLNLDASVMFTDGEVFAPLGDDYDYYTPNLVEQRDNPVGETQNKGTTTEGDWVIEVPKGSKVESVVFSSVYIMSNEEYTVSLKDAPKPVAVGDSTESDEDLVTEDATTEEEAPVEDESTSTEEEALVEDETDATETEEEETVTSDDTENMDALAEAQEFLDYGPLSRKALYETLCGDYGMGYSESAAEYAVDNVGANWNEMALGSAHILLEGVPDMSDDEIYATLVGEGMGFTDAEAQYAIDNLGSN